MHSLLFLAISMGLALAHSNFLRHCYLDSSPLVPPVMPAYELEIVVVLLVLLVVAVVLVLVVDSAAFVAVAVVDSVVVAVRFEFEVRHSGFVRLSSVRT